MLVYFHKRNLQKKPSTLLALVTGVGGEVRRGWGIRVLPSGLHAGVVLIAIK